MIYLNEPPRRTRFTYKDLSYEAIALRDRVLADGGVVVDLPEIDFSIKQARRMDFWSSVFGWYSANFAYKDAGSGKVSTLYNIVSRQLAGQQTLLDFLQSTDAKRPIWSADAQNGRPKILFDGSDDWMATALSSTTSINQPNTIFAVYKLGAGATGAIVDGNNVNGRNLLYGRPADSKVAYFAGTERSGTVSVNNAIHVVSGYFMNGTGFLRQDGADLGASALCGTQPQIGMTIGADYLRTAVGITIYEILCVSGYPPSFVDVEAFLNKKWAVY